MKTIKFYHTEKKECFAQLEDWILKKDLEIDDVVNEKLGQWFQIYKEQHPKMSEVTLEKEKKRRRSQLLECHRLILYAYNGSRYENQFIYKSKRLLFDYVLEKYGIIEIMLKGSRIVFRDSMRMLGGGSLEKQCKDYKIPEKYAKHQFPHKFMTRNTFFYKGKPPEDKYWENGMPDKYKDPNYVYDLQKESAEYNAYDTISDCIILYEFSKSIKNVTGLDILDFTTISALAYNYAMENVPPEMVYLPTNRAIDEFIRLSFQGGRCFRQKVQFTSNYYGMFQDLHKKDNQRLLRYFYNLCEDHYLVIDAVSLYPSAMWNFEFPTGIPFWATEQDLEMVKTKLNNCNESLLLGFVEVEVKYPNRNIITPLLAKKKGLQLRYSSEKKQKFASKTTIDVMEEVRNNKAIVTRVCKALLYPSKCFLFREIIETLFNLRLGAKKNKNDSMKGAIKVLLNSIHGKFEQMLYEIKNLIIDDTEDGIKKLLQYYREGQVTSDLLMPNGQCITEITNRLDHPAKVKDPAHLGALCVCIQQSFNE